MNFSALFAAALGLSSVASSTVVNFGPLSSGSFEFGQIVCETRIANSSDCSSILVSSSSSSETQATINFVDNGRVGTPGDGLILGFDLFNVGAYFNGPGYPNTTTYTQIFNFAPAFGSETTENTNLYPDLSTLSVPGVNEIATNGQNGFSTTIFVTLDSAGDSTGTISAN